MARGEGAQYIDRMKPPGSAWLPTLCRVCHRWQASTLCSQCLTLAALDTPRCVRCGLATRTVRLEPCERCEDWPPAFDHAVAALEYVSPWSSLIAALKFREDPALAGFLGHLLARQVAQRWACPPSTVAARDARSTRRTSATPRAQSAVLPMRRGAPTAVIPVPLSAQRLRERGYNQAWLLARHAARPWQLPVLPRALIRQRDTARLMSLDADERAQQIRGAFSVNPALLPQVVGRHVAVVDDVLTTGATLNEIASTLWLAGAREVSVWVVARTPPPQAGAAADAAGLAEQCCR